MPKQATGLTRTDRRKVRTNAQNMFGDYGVTKTKGETLRKRYRNISRIAPVASTGEGLCLHRLQARPFNIKFQYIVGRPCRLSIHMSQRSRVVSMNGNVGAGWRL